MAEREQKKKPTRKREAPPVDEAKVEPADAATLKAELDDLLDEIDEVLEENAEEFVKAYVQRGGQ